MVAPDREAFLGRIAAALDRHGFAPNKHATKMKRKVGLFTSSVEISSGVLCFVSLYVDCRTIAKVSPGWRAGGNLNAAAWALDAPTNLDLPESADALERTILAELPFFDLIADPDRMLVEVCRRYVRGLFAPALVAPYLEVLLGPPAVKTYASSLLAGRPELWPAFASTKLGAFATSESDHGTQLGSVVADVGPAPSDVVPSLDSRARHLRCFFGRQLRAWGEPEAAAELRRVTDAEIFELRLGQANLEAPLVDSRVAVERLLVALGTKRGARRDAPSPRHFQYHASHASFASS